MTDPLIASIGDQQVAGGFRVFVSPPVGPRREISMFRDVPIVPTQWSWGDPFSEETAVLSCPQITPWDTPGQGDLSWLIEGADVDIIWQPLPGSPVTDPWSWEGYIASFDFGIDEGGTNWQIQLRGCNYALDGYLAMPQFPEYPLPYEYLLRQAFDPELHPCSLGPLDVVFPNWWNTYAPPPVPGENARLRPAGVLTGSMWTGLTSRATGSWNPMLTGFAASLLQVMFNADGSQWTIRNRGNRSPQLMVREVPSDLDQGILNVDLGAPGVTVNLSKDFSQAVNVIYGTGTDTQGVNYSGMQMSADGQTISYTPFAFNPAAYPRSGAGKMNPLFNPQRKTRESFSAFQQGLTQTQAQQVARGQLQRLNDPGMTGSITLKTDPYLSDPAKTPFFRLLIRDGATIRVHGLLGIPEGVLFHVGEVKVDAVNLTVSLTVDTKYRDLLTIDEVHARTLDPLKLLHSLQSNNQQNLIQDLLMPWSYANGSGCIPHASATFYNSMPSGERFPYSNDLSQPGATRGWCQKYPPSRYPEFYVRIGPTDQHDSSKNWADYSQRATMLTGGPAIPVLMSAAGTASQFQMAAYDKDGNVIPVKFHVSLYKVNSTAVENMPMWTKNPYLVPERLPPILGPKDYADVDGAYFNSRWPGGEGGTAWYGSEAETVAYKPYDVENPKQAYHPFFQGAWQTQDEQGHSFQTATGMTNRYTPSDSVGLIVGWGTYYVPAGFWPGQPGGGPITGMLVDTTPWSWDTNSSLNSQSLTPTSTGMGGITLAGRVYAMIYCEDQGQQDVYFLGKVLAQSQNGQ